MTALNQDSNSGSESQNQQNRKIPGTVPGAQAAPPVTLIPNNTLITNTPEEGRALAVKMARLIVKATQPDEAVRERLRDVYANDAAMLIQITHVTAIEFQTVAAANNYWRKSI